MDAVSPVPRNPEDNLRNDHAGGRLPLASRLLYVLLVLLGLWSVFGSWALGGFSSSAEDGVDNRLNNYFLEHSYLVLLDAVGVRDYPGSLWSPPIFFPAKGTLAYSDNHFGLAPVYWLLRILLDPWRAFQGWVAFGFIGTFAATGWACRRLGASHAVSAVAAFLFAFGMPRVAQHMAAHDQLVPQVFAPLAVVAAWSFVRRPRHSALAATLALLLWQLVTAIYLGWFLFLGFGVAVVLAYLWPDHWRRLGAYLRRGWPIALLILIAWAGATLAFLWPYLAASHEFGAWGQQYIANTLPRWHSYLRPAPATLWWPSLRDLSSGEGYGVELHLFMGFAWLTFLALAVWGVIIKTPKTNGDADSAGAADERVKAKANEDLAPRRLAIILLTAAMLLTLASLRLPTGHSPWWYLYKLIPGGETIRAVSRIWTVTYLFALLGTAVGVTLWLHRFRERRARSVYRFALPVLGVVAALAVAEQVTWRRGALATSPFGAQVADASRDIREAGLGPDDVFFLYPPGFSPGVKISEDDVWRTHMVAMWASLATGVPTANGYSARAPRGYPAEREMPPPEAMREWLQTHAERSAIFTLGSD